MSDLRPRKPWEVEPLPTSLFNEYFFAVSRSPALKNDSSVTSLCKFAELKTNKDRVDFATKFLEDFVYPPTEDSVKCNMKSWEFREKGNEAFRGGNFKLAFESYNESIALAPEKSESLLLALGNRSAVLKHLGRYENCLRDLNEALDMNCPSNLRKKLIARREEVSKLLAEESNSPEKKEEEYPRKMSSVELGHSYDNPELGAATKWVSLNYNEKRGRHLVATQDISPGDLLMVEEPFVALVDPGKKFEFCSECFTRSFSLLPCPNCSWAMYCSRDCLEKSADGHILECSLLPTFIKVKLPFVALMVIKILSRIGMDEFLETRKTGESEDKRTEGFTSGFYSSSSFKAAYHLVSHSNLRPSLELFHLSLITACVTKQLEQFLEYPLKFGEQFLYLLEILDMNRMDVFELKHPKYSAVDYRLPSLWPKTGEEFVKIGQGLYVTLSMLNHSCDPNADCRTSFGSTKILRALRSIPAGTEITIQYRHYNFLELERRERRDLLLRNFMFKCKCEACVESWTQGKYLPEKPQLKILDLKTASDFVRYCSLGLPRLSNEGEISEELSEACICRLKFLHNLNGRLCLENFMMQEYLFMYFARKGNMYNEVVQPKLQKT